MPTPHVGIFWMLPDGRILIDSTPLDEAEKHDRWLIHSGSHIRCWSKWKWDGTVPAALEYDQLPRGRVAYDWVREHFTLLADRRILEDQVAMQEIMHRLGLPPDSEVGTDPHYVTEWVDDWDGEDD